MQITPTSGQAMPTDNFLIEWSYDGYLTGSATMQFSYDGEDAYGALYTTVDWSESSITLPPSVLPHVAPGSTTSFAWLWAYTITSGDGYEDSDLWSVYPDIALYASTTHTSTTTTTHTSTTPTTDTSSPTPPPVSNSNDPESGGLSTGAKAGIGVGVSAGAILVAAGAFLFFRRRKRQEPKTIREIPSASATNLAGPGPGPGPTAGTAPQLAWKPANASSSGNSYEMS